MAKTQRAKEAILKSEVGSVDTVLQVEVVDDELEAGQQDRLK